MLTAGDAGLANGCPCMPFQGTSWPCFEGRRGGEDLARTTGLAPAVQLGGHLYPAPWCVQAKGVDLILPKDVVVADKFAPDADSKIVPIDKIPEGWMVRYGLSRGRRAGEGGWGVLAGIERRVCLAWSRGDWRARHGRRTCHGRCPART